LIGLLLAVLFTALMYPYVRTISHGTHLRYVNTATRSFKDLDDMVLCTDPAPVPKLFSLWPLFLSWLMLSWPLYASKVRNAFPDNEFATGIWLAVGAFLLGKLVFDAMLTREAVKFLGWSFQGLYQTARAHAVEFARDSLQKYLVIAAIALLTFITALVFPAIERAWQHIHFATREIVSGIPGCSTTGRVIPLAVTLPWGVVFIGRWLAHLKFVRGADANRGRIEIPEAVYDLARDQQKFWRQVFLEKAGPGALIGHIPPWHVTLHKLSLISFGFAMFFVSVAFYCGGYSATNFSNLRAPLAGFLAYLIIEARWIFILALAWISGQILSRMPYSS
jgi:hypothetical protein